LDLDFLFRLTCRNWPPGLNLETGRCTLSCGSRGEKAADVRKQIDRVLQSLKAYTEIEKTEGTLKGLDQENADLNIRVIAIEAERHKLAQEQEHLRNQLDKLSDEKERDKQDFANQREKLSEELSRLVQQSEGLVNERDALVHRKRQLEIIKRDLRKQIEVLKDELRKARQKSRRHSETARRSERWVIALSGIVAATVMLFVTLSIIRSRSQANLPRHEVNATQQWPSSTPTPTFVARDNAHAEPSQPKPTSELSEELKATPKAEPMPAGSPATEKQMNYLGSLIHQHGWSDLRRDAEISKVLGVPRSFSNLRKQEASKLIDAWKALSGENTQAQESVKKPMDPKAKATAEIVCPTCGAKMVVRINRKTGEKFYGCSKFPECKATRSYTEP
jgi:predicted RNA-binding Zn-ribbon protein involved in translation (DUF1610 family)